MESVAMESVARQVVAGLMSKDWHAAVPRDGIVASRCGLMLWPSDTDGGLKVAWYRDVMLAGGLFCTGYYPPSPPVTRVGVARDTRRFRLVRHEDESGVSGTGMVAEGVVFTNGRVAMSWLTMPGSEAFYQSIKDVEAIHGHGGKTVVEYIDA